jgi:hypothetical protein
MPPIRLLRIVVPALAIGLVLAIQTIYFERGFVPGDTFTYLSAGERLNDGHLLYALSPGDRPVDLKPPFWTVPLLSPPPIAVLFRPLAALPNEFGVYVWWGTCIVAIVGTTLVMMRRRPILVGLAAIVLSVPIVYEIGVGNLNALLLAGFVATWYLIRVGRHVPAGVIVALMTALKLTPGILLWWLITQRRWTAVRAFFVTGLAIAAISLIGAGLPAHIEYLGIMRQTTTAGTSEGSVAGIARLLGVAPMIANMLPALLLLIGTLTVGLLRHRPGAAYAAVMVTMLLGSPVLNVNWFTLLLATLAPIVWPITDEQRSTTATATSVDTASKVGPAVA